MPIPQPTSGTVEFTFTYQPAQKRALEYVKRGAGTYLQIKNPQWLEIGGQRSGKTVGKLMFGVQNYCLRWSHCDILVLRRTFSELDSGVIQDFKTFVPEQLYTFNQTTRVGTFKNGSRVVFAGCVNNLDRDIEKYLGQTYPFILVDECGQFSPNAWEMLYARNLVNAACQEDEYGNLPAPAIVGCTNPIGPFWEYYHQKFVKHEPWEKEEGMRRAKDGSWWRLRSGEPVLAYNPNDYGYNHTTVLDNAVYLKRDPRVIERLRSLPEAKMKKLLLGYMDTVDGQFFDCFDYEQHVIDLREDPEAIVWEDWQPVWGGQDFGVGHWNAIYLFTKAKVRLSIGNEYRTKVVCFQEIAPETTGQTNVELANMLNAKAYYPRLPEDHPQHDRISGKRCKVSALYFSHEKFNRGMEAHSPADEYSRLLRERGLPSVSRASMDRIGSASFMYNMLKTGGIVILRTCPGIIQAIPSLQRDKDELDDVLKSDSKSDDRYDAFRYGLFGALGTRRTPQIEKDIAEANNIEDKFARYFFLQKKRYEAAHAKDTFVQKEGPLWESKI